MRPRRLVGNVVVLYGSGRLEPLKPLAVMRREILQLLTSGREPGTCLPCRLIGHVIIYLGALCQPLLQQLFVLPGERCGRKLCARTRRGSHRPTRLPR
jgi:hypothetical protein